MFGKILSGFFGYSQNNPQSRAARLISQRDSPRFALYSAGPMTLLLEPGNECDAGVIRGNFESAQREYLSSLIAQVQKTTQAKLRFLDVGAHWGYYSLCMLYSGNFDQICAFEADPFNYSQLRTQLMLNNATVSIESFNYAITQAAMLVPWTLSATHLPNNRAGVGIYGPGELRIEGRTLDSLVTPDERVIFAKIDVEGHEREVLKGAKQLLSASHAVLQVESVDHVDDIGEIVADYGYRKLNVIDIDHYFTNIPALTK